MTYYLVFIPKEGEPQIVDYKNLTKNHKGGEVNFYGIFKCKGCESFKCVAYMLYDNISQVNEYNYKNNRTCDVIIYQLDDFYRKELLGYDKDDAETIIDNIQKS
jgi:hypothetical protein